MSEHGHNPNALKALEMRADWSKWLVSLQTALCAGMWIPVTEELGRGSWSIILMVLAWICFALSAVLSAFLLGLLPDLVRQLGDADERNQEKSHLSTRRVDLLALWQHVLFASGAGMILLYLLFQAMFGV